MPKVRTVLILVDLVLFLVVVILSFLVINTILTSPGSANQKVGEKVKETLPTAIPKKDSKKADLSYIIITINDENSQLNLTDQVGKKVGEVSIEEPVQDISGTSKNTVGALNTLYFAKPSSGIYFLYVTLTKDSYIDIYLYDEGKGTLTKTINGKKGESQFKINFDKENANNSSVK